MKNSFFAAELDQNAPMIDLHGVPSVEDALDMLERDLYSIQQSGASYCRVVHGVGEGVLAAAVQGALDKNPMIGGWKKEENGGSCVVVF